MQDFPVPAGYPHVPSLMVLVTVETSHKVSRSCLINADFVHRADADALAFKCVPHSDLQVGECVAPVGLSTGIVKE